MFRIGKLNHIAIATADLKGHLRVFRDILGAKCSERVAQREHGVYTTFIELPNTKIELLEELGPESPISAFLKKRPEGGIHHLCYEVEDIQLAARELQRHGLKPLGEVKIGAHGRPVLFLHPRDCNGILTELEEVEIEDNKLN